MGGVGYRLVRRELGISSFGINGFTADAGAQLIEEHDELGSNARHEEVYVVLGGRARFTVDGEEHEATAGTFVFLPDPASRRTAVALEDGTSAIAIGGRRGSRTRCRCGRQRRPQAARRRRRPRRGRGPVAEARPSSGLPLRPRVLRVAGRPPRGGARTPASGDRDQAREARDWAAKDSDLDPLRDDPALPRLGYRADGQAQVGRAPTRPGRQRALRHRLRQRRLLDLLRARARRVLRARPDTGDLHHHRLLLLLHRRHLRRSDGDVSGGRRVVLVRAARVQRVLVLLRRVGPDAQLHHHDRHLGVLRAPLHRRAVLGAAALGSRRHHRRCAGHRRARDRQRRRRQGVGRAQHPARRRRLPHPGAAGRPRRGARSRPGHPHRQRRARRRTDLGGLRALDPDRDDRLHGHRDDLEHGRRGQDEATTIPRPINRVRLAVFAIYFTLPAVALSALPVEQVDGEYQYSRCWPAGGGGRLRGRPDPRRGQADRPWTVAVRR